MPSQHGRLRFPALQVICTLSSHWFPVRLILAGVLTLRLSVNNQSNCAIQTQLSCDPALHKIYSFSRNFQQRPVIFIYAIETVIKG